MFTVKDDNFPDIVMSNLFANLEKPLMVEIIRKRTRPGKNTEIRFDKTAGTTLENDFSIFLSSGGREFCDINLVLDGHIIPAHKSILSARCSYFQAMFRSFMPPDNTVNVSISLKVPYLKSNRLNFAVIFRFKSGTFRRPKRHSTLCCVTFTTAKRKCHQKIPCIYFKRLASTVKPDSNPKWKQQFNHEFRFRSDQQSVAGILQTQSRTQHPRTERAPNPRGVGQNERAGHKEIRVEHDCA